MPIFASEPATTVRQRSPWLLPKPAYGAIFLTVALAAYGWKSFSSRAATANVPPQATAKVCIHDPNFAFQHAWQEILAQAKAEVRENLHVEAQRSGQETVVAISLSNLPAESIVPMVNVVASAYSQACCAEWKLHIEQAYSAAEEKVRQTERQAIRGPDAIRIAPRSPAAGAGEHQAGCAAAYDDGESALDGNLPPSDGP